MTFAIRLFRYFYGVLLRFYPRRFRAEFGSEMRAVFAEAVAGAAARGWVPLVVLFLRELRDWPGVLLWAHWLVFRKGMVMGEHMVKAAVSSGNGSTLEGRHAPVPWREALLAGLPHALVALTIQAGAVASAFGLLPSLGQGRPVVQIMLAGVFGLSMVVAMVIAWRREWPRWSASWLGYVFILLLGLLGQALQAWGSTLGGWWRTQLLDAYLGLLVPSLLAIMLCALGLRNRLRFLLTLLPLLPLLWSPVLEFSAYPVRAVVVLAIWLVAALLAALIARVGRVRTGIWLTLALNLAVGLAYTYTRTYHAHFPPEAPAHYSLPPTFLDWLNRFAPGVLAVSVVIIEPLLLRKLRVWGRRTGRLGVLGFRLSLVGLILLLAAGLTASWWFSSGWSFINRVWGYEVGRRFWLSILAYVAIFLCLSGAGFFGAALVRTGPSIEEGAALFLALVLVVMPVTAALLEVHGFWDIRTIPRIWGYVVGLPWLALGVWLVGRRSTRRVSGAAA